MKKIISFIILALAIIACTKEAKTPAASGDAVDLRYRAKDVYDLPASNAPAFSIVVKSTKPWTLKSTHPTWCMIETEEGEAVPDSLVHVGKGENTTVKVQYYDNLKLDDRTDTIIIASQHWIGKRVIVNQKGIAYLEVDVEERELDMKKSGDDVSFHIKSNQNWSVAAADDDSNWLTIKEGATGSLDGVVTVGGPDNSGEMRSGRLNIFDRNGKKMKWQVVITQDGVQLEPVAVKVYNEDTKKNDLEIREDYNAHTAELAVKSNTSWTIAKKNASDSWFTLLDAGGTDNASARIQFTQNEGTEVRESFIVLTTVPSEPGAAVISKEVKVRQAYKMQPVRYNMNEDSFLGRWYNDGGSDWDATIELVAVETGVLMPSNLYMRYKDSIPISGTHTFRFGNIQDDANIRGWFYWRVSGSGDKYLKLELDRNGKLGSPYASAISGTYDVKDYLEITLKNTPLDNGFFHVAVAVNGVDKGAFDSSPELFPLCVVAGGTIGKLCFGVQGGGSAVMEWYEYLAPFSWE